MQVLIPIFKKSMYTYSCGSIPKRGNSYGKKYIEKILKKDKINKIIKKQKYTWYDATQLMSYYGWIKHTNSYNLFEKYFSNNKIYIVDLKKKISNHQKYLNSEGG